MRPEISRIIYLILVIHVLRDNILLTLSVKGEQMNKAKEEQNNG